ncbi:transglycosylase domain-containing protein [Catellatospora methionotrophica]|uniref:transglycosylase domain-containing protein n=1 Tax=Catellatospora methionotrophica TaxID=121620 RepID=UPI0033FC5F21
MTVVDAQPWPPATPSPRGRRLRWISGALIALLVISAGVLGFAAYYTSTVPEPPQFHADHPIVRVADLPTGVTNAFVAALDPDFYAVADRAAFTPSPISRRYILLAIEDTDADESTWRIRIMADELEEVYTPAEILGFYLNSADYGRGAVGLVAAAQAYFGRQPAQLTIAEAALLAVRLDPDRPQSKDGWTQVIDTMAQRGMLGGSERAALVYPRIQGD